eukprot:c8209_g1_i2.p1 GENE.c8209_g1_i2~~c8209_g1_i2.p1  ORF type:complete len:391 (+),score=101.51 c8209_g1_i2:1370-2542(+)
MENQQIRQQHHRQEQQLETPQQQDPPQQEESNYHHHLQQQESQQTSFTTCAQMFDVWVNEIATKHLPVRDLVAFSMANKWAYKISHDVIEHKEIFCKSINNNITIQNVLGGAKFWPNLKFSFSICSWEQPIQQQDPQQQQQRQEQQQYFPRRVQRFGDLFRDNELLAVSGVRFEMCWIQNFGFLDTNKLEMLTITRALGLNDEIASCSFRRLLADCSSLTSFDFSHFPFRHSDDGVWLAKALANFPKLTHLNLESNHFGDDRGHVLFRAIANLHNLKSLNLGRNKLSAAGCSALSACISHLPHLHTLDLKMNNLDPVSMTSLAPAIANLEHLKDLCLCGNRLTYSGVEALLCSIAHLTSLSHLNVYMNDLNRQQQAHVRAQLSRIPKLLI